MPCTNLSPVFLLIRIVYFLYKSMLPAFITAEHSQPVSYTRGIGPPDENNHSKQIVHSDIAVSYTHLRAHETVV